MATINTVKKTVKLHFKEGDALDPVAITILNGTRRMYSLSVMTEAQDDEFWETDRAQLSLTPSLGGPDHYTNAPSHYSGGMAANKIA